MSTRRDSSPFGHSPLNPRLLKNDRYRQDSVTEAFRPCLVSAVIYRVGISIDKAKISQHTLWLFPQCIPSPKRRSGFNGRFEASELPLVGVRICVSQL